MTPAGIFGLLGPRTGHSTLRRTLESSRQLILEAIGNPPDVTFIRSAGNIGDELIWAGIRALLSPLKYREVYGGALAGIQGHTALVAGGGAWCWPYHEFMPALLTKVTQSFQRVIVLPSSFDTSVPVVRESLSQTSALIFAREKESYQQIQPLCNAALAHDCAFYYDFKPFMRVGSGILNAFRSDSESKLSRMPADNNDISVTSPNLNAWLTAISQYARINTDRAHVMIAGAMLGKQVRYLPSSYHKVPAIASFSLQGFDVFPLLNDRTLHQSMPGLDAGDA